jgi:hypothetical protein
MQITLGYRKPPGHQTHMTKIEPLLGQASLKQLAQGKRKNIEGCETEKTNNT